MRNPLEFASILTAIALAVATVVVMTTIGPSPEGYNGRGIADQAPFKQASAVLDRG